MKIQKTFLMIILIVAIGGSWTYSSANDGIEIMKKSHLSMFYAGQDGIADVKMTITNSRGKERIREFAMLRLDIEDGGKQKYYTYFRKPHDVSRITFMVHKMPEASDNRWLYVPSVDLVKRISADDKGSSFVGSDFTYEDVSGRHWSEDSHTILKEDKFGDNDVYVIESTPNEKYKGFSRKVSYIDKGHYLPLKEEYYNKKDELIRVFTAEKIEDIDGIMTPTIRKMENVKKEQYTVVEFENIKFDIGVEEDVFSERYLKNPPRKFIK